ncbi:MAG: response regulator transcription factor [Pseudomonadota bacterium]
MMTGVSQELLLRVDAILRRSRLGSKQEATVLSLDGLTIDRRQQTVHANDTVLDVTPTQLNLLWTLVKNQAEVLSKAFLYQTVLNRSYSTYDRSLDMHLSRVRRKLNEAGWDGARLQTVHGKGYCFR